jgi:PTH1 family peptidyl-tRNA hydrolase
MTTIQNRLIIGLGNPGREYEKTRHNIGFDVIDAFASVHRIAVTRSSGRALIGDGMIGETRVTLMKPQTFMNLSGEALAAFLRNKPLPPSEIIVVTDDIHLPVGKLRLRPGGSDGGHNGLKSIAAHLHTKEYPRLRVGVGSPPTGAEQIDFVLGRFSRADQKTMDDMVQTCGAALDVWLSEGLEKAMNKFNG